MTTTEQKLTLAREALDHVVEANRELLLKRSQLGIAKYGATLADAKHPAPVLIQHAIEEVLDLANYLQALLRAESAPAAPIQTDKERIDCLRVSNAQLRERAENAEYQLTQLREVVAYEQRHAATSEVALAEEKDRADRAEALAMLREDQRNAFHNRLADFMPPGEMAKMWESMLSQDKAAALAQRAAGDLPKDGVHWDLFPAFLINHHERDVIYEESMQEWVTEMLKDENYKRVAQDRAILAARAVSGVDAETLRHALEMVDGCMDETQVEPEDVAAWQLVRKYLVAPVGDGDERAALTALVYAIDNFDIDEPEVSRALNVARAALTQQKGS